jgi:hypothetical protein
MGIFIRLASISLDTGRNSDVIEPMTISGVGGMSLALIGLACEIITSAGSRHFPRDQPDVHPAF